MISQSNVDLLFCSLRGRGREAQETTGTGNISNVTQTFNYISAKGSSSGSQKTVELNMPQIAALHKPNKALESS